MSLPLDRWQFKIYSIPFFLVYLLPAGVFTWSVMGPIAQQTAGKNERAAIFIGLALFGTLVLKFWRPKTSWPAAFGCTLLVYGVIHRMLAFIPDVSTFPWSLGWSEASRYYYASLFFSEKVYGQTIPLSVLHPTRYLMQSLPFILPEAGLWLHRLWQVILWVGMSALTGWAIARWFKAGWWLAALSILFLFEGPVYYHLMAIVVLILAGVQPAKFTRTLVVVVVASLWAGVSRVNWYPMPGLLASLLYLIQVPLIKKSWVRYSISPAVWTLIGTGTAFIAQAVYIHLSGNPVGQFSSSFTSELLWYRLWPNATYGLGIIRSIWRITFPMFLIIMARWAPNWRRFHFLRISGIAAILVVLMVGGIMVSVKIGGGSNLHNLDAFLVVLLVVSVAFYTLKVVPEKPQPLRARSSLWPLVFFVLLFPIRDVTQLGGALPVRDMGTAWRDVKVLKEVVESKAQSGGEVLFIDQRHLLTTHVVDNVTLVPDYEVVFLMEMAMGNNRPYLIRFVQDLQENRFAYIVSGTPSIHYQDLDKAFAEENNIWVERVTVPLLCYYQVAMEFPDSGISLLTPRTEPCE